MSTPEVVLLWSTPECVCTSEIESQDAGSYNPALTVHIRPHDLVTVQRQAIVLEAGGRVLKRVRDKQLLLGIGFVIDHKGQIVSRAS
jgi:hypothetical protein